MGYKALTYLVLMDGGRKIAPGDEISDAELEEANQTDEDIQRLLDSGAISDDYDAPLHSDHAPVEAPVVRDETNDGRTHVSSGDGGGGVDS